MSVAQKLEILRLWEEKRRLQARNDLNAYCRYIEIPGAPIHADDPDCEEFYPDTVVPAEHHRLINRTLMRVEAGELKRVMIFMPPGSAKSTYGTVTFPTWFMGRKKGRHIITTSYASDLATKFGRKCRAITRSKQYYEVFDACLNADNKAAHDWSISNGNTYMAAGILAGITGNRADGIVIDDPIKGREDADSETIREKTWEAYKSDIRTRLKPGGFILIIQTRWHEDDISGRILPKNYNGESGWITARDGEKWYVLCLPAQAEHDDDPLGRKVGEWLWTDWFSPEHWEQERRTQGARNWDALFQQRPKPSDGAMFKRAWFGRYNTPPAEPYMIVQSLDTAFKADQINDPSVIETWAIVRLDGSRYHALLLHTWRDRVEYPILKHTAINLANQWKPSAILIEDKASGQSLLQDLRAATSLPVVAIEPDGDKISRANAVSAYVEAGLVHLPEVADWLIDFESEVFGFPLTKNDDQVDAMTQFLRWFYSRMVEIDSWGTGTRESIRATQESGSQLDEDMGYGTVRSDTDMGGF